VQYQRDELVRFWEHHDEGLDVSRPQALISLSHDLYRRIPPGFNLFFDFAQRLAVQPLLVAGRPKPGQLVLDIGCGTGRWARMCQRYGLRTVGVDLGARALRAAKRLATDGEWARNCLPHLSFKSCVFDWAVSVTVLQHINYEEQIGCLLEVYRVLKPHGKFVVLELSRAEDRAPHVFARSREDWEALFRKAGFAIVARAGCERVPWVEIARWLRRFIAPEQPGKSWLPGRAAHLAAPAFVPLAVVAELAVTALRLDRWTRYTGWLLTRA
jgi:ubiquinone/menaquinone biosynthesis C-methylase UbiE